MIEVPPAATPSRGAGLSRTLTIVILAIVAVALAVDTITAITFGAPVVGYIAIAVSALGVVLLRRRPYLSLALIAVAAPLAASSGAVSTGLWSIACFAVFLLALRGSSALIGGAVIAVSNFIAAAGDAGTIDVTTNASASVAAFAALASAAIGSAIRGNLRYRHEVEERLHDAERSRSLAIERGVAQERLRIARDLHDSVGHQVAVVNMRLGAAEVHLPLDADAAHADIAAARAGLQEVLRETQHILQVLRMDGGPDRSEHVYRTIPEVIASFRDAGMQIEDIVDSGEELSPLASAAVFRVLQEGLTNAQKHGTGSVAVTVTHSPESAVVHIANRRAAPVASAPVPGGNGLVGMRERVMSVGGTLDIGSDDRIFWLTATIPTGTGDSP